MPATTRRRPINLSIDAEVLARARRKEVNISRAAEDGVRAALRLAKKERWLEQNHDALESSNAWVESEGLPLSPFRQF